MTFLTIVTVVRNDAEGLRRTGETLLRQTDRDFDWRIVDGASTDGTLAVAEDFKTAFEKIHISSERDAGIYDAMNKGLRAATGEHILFLNAGDVFAHPKVIEGIRQALQTRPCDILFGASKMLYGNRSIYRRPKDPSYIWHGQPGLHQATVVKSALHRQFEYNLGFSVCADYECLCRMASAGADMAYTDLLISLNEITPQSSSTRYKIRMIKECFAIQREALGTPLPTRLLSACRRGVNGVFAKGLAWAFDHGGGR